MRAERGQTSVEFLLLIGGALLLALILGVSLISAGGNMKQTIEDINIVEISQ